uniref:Secreted protein n=2 Tax=Echinococcus granulosus TaxID=6210 RepID=A0A7E4T5Q2_ECHGR
MISRGLSTSIAFASSSFFVALNMYELMVFSNGGSKLNKILDMPGTKVRSLTSFFELDILNTLSMRGIFDRTNSSSSSGNIAASVAIAIGVTSETFFSNSDTRVVFPCGTVVIGCKGAYSSRSSPEPPFS